MTERRETDQSFADGERIAKYLASAGVASRRDVERLITDGRVSVDGKVLDTPAFKVTGREKILVDGRPISRPEAARLWRYHKPEGLVTTNKDPEGRPTIFGGMPKDMPRVVTVGRLDLNTEGLLLLTNDGELARALELPATGLQRSYRARAYGRIEQKELDRLREGIVHEGIEYKSIIARLDRQTASNCWIDVTLTEGKNREVRRALESLGLKVNRLIRVSYGPFKLDDLGPGAVEEVEAAEILAEFGNYISDKRKPKPFARKAAPPRAKVSHAKPIHAKQTPKVAPVERDPRVVRKGLDAFVDKRPDKRGPGGAKRARPTAPGVRPTGGRPTSGRSAVGGPSGGKPGGSRPGGAKPSRGPRTPR
jgi:23S rRNA pseudouridine2605 synthase